MLYPKSAGADAPAGAAGRGSIGPGRNEHGAGERGADAAPPAVGEQRERAVTLALQNPYPHAGDETQHRQAPQQGRLPRALSPGGATTRGGGGGGGAPGGGGPPRSPIWAPAAGHTPICCARTE